MINDILKAFTFFSNNTQFVDKDFCFPVSSLNVGDKNVFGGPALLFVCYINASQ